MEWYMWVIIYIVIGFVSACFVSFCEGTRQSSVSESDVALYWIFWPLIFPLAIIYYGISLIKLMRFMESINKKGKNL